jgi:methyl-accepting chemotaxis protein
MDVASTNEDLHSRLDRLERDLREISGRGPAMNQISLAGWLKLSGPTFATMVFGFTLLWSAQQANTAQILELSRSSSAQIMELSRSSSAQILEVSRAVGRLEGAIPPLEASISGLDARVGRLETAVTSLDGRVARLEDAITRLDTRIDKLGTAVDKLAERVALPPS